MQQDRPDRPPPWIGSQYVADRLGITSARVVQLARHGVLPAEKHRGEWRFRRDQVDVVIAARLAKHGGRRT